MSIPVNGIANANGHGLDQQQPARRDGASAGDGVISPHAPASVAVKSDTGAAAAAAAATATSTAASEPLATPQTPPPPQPLHRFPLPGLSLPTDFQPILQDHHAVLYPNYSTPFASAQDVIARLLPWHVWQVPEDVIALAKGMQFVPPGSKEAAKALASNRGKQKEKAKATDESVRADDDKNAAGLAVVNGVAGHGDNSHTTTSPPPPRKRRRRSHCHARFPRIEYGQDIVPIPRTEKAGAPSTMAPFERIQGIDFPTLDEMESIVSRYSSIHERVRGIRHVAEGGSARKGDATTSTDADAAVDADHEPTPAAFARESHLQLLEKFHADERAELDALLAELKQARFDMMSQYGGRWQLELDKVAPGLPAINRDELYNPPPPPVLQPQQRFRAPTTTTAQQQPTATTMCKSPAASASASPAPTTTTSSKPQSPTRQRSPVAQKQAAGAAAAAAASTAQPRKRPSVTPASSPGPGVGAPLNGTNGPSRTATPAVSRPTSMAPQQQQQPQHPHQTGIATTSAHAHSYPPPPPPPHLPLHMQHHYAQQPQQPQQHPNGGGPPAGMAMPAMPLATSPPPPPPLPATGGQPPIRVVLPLNLIQTLTEAGITPQPAPHLKPAIEAHKRRAAQAAAQGTSAPPLVSTGGEGEDSPTGGYSTAPVDPDPAQTYAAVLLGITEAAIPNQPDQKYQLIHLSLKLDRLQPNQLQALASAVNMVQGQQAMAAATTTPTAASASPTAANAGPAAVATPTTTSVMGMQGGAGSGPASAGLNAQASRPQQQQQQPPHT